MDYKYVGERIWRELHRMTKIVAMLRTLNEQAATHPCAFDRYVLFFAEVRWALLEALIMGTSRVTDQRRDCLHFGGVLSSALRAFPPKVKLEELAEVHRMYQEVHNSKQLDAVKSIRHETIAHLANSSNPDETLDGMTWGEVYDVVARLSDVFNKASDAALWDHRVMPSGITYVTGAGMRDLKEDIKAIIEVLEASSHNDQLHARLLRQANTH